MEECEKCRGQMLRLLSLENELLLGKMVLDAIHRVVIGERVSDFGLSFPEVREVADKFEERLRKG